MIEKPVVVDEYADIPDKYRDLLAEHGIVPHQSASTSLRHEIRPCCTNMELFENKEALMTCWNCAKVNYSAVPHFMFVFPSNDDCDMSRWNNGKHKNVGVQMPPKKRYYSSKIHFSTHLKRYLNHNIPVDIDAAILEDIRQSIDIHDFEAYAHVRKYLWNRKLGRYYKDIFSIIYACGGKIPVLSPQQHQHLDRLIISLQNFFYDNKKRWGKKSMPCVSLMLEYLLRQCGHELHYRLHMLKDQSLLDAANDFYTCYMNEVGFI